MTRMVKRHPPKRSRKEPTRRLVLEALESRTLLSVFAVDRLTDNDPAGGGEGSGLAGDLRYCITKAGDGDAITFGDGVTGTINLAGALPELAHSVRLDGPWADRLTVRRDTGGSYRIFTVDSGATVQTSGLTITNGDLSSGGDGGGILNDGTLTVSHSIITQNSALGSGGGILNDGTLTIISSTVRDNSAGAHGGGIANEPYLQTPPTLTIISSSISGNGASLGGGIANYGPSILIMTSSTVSDNTADEGGGIYNTTAHATIANSTLSGNSRSGIEDFYDDFPWLTLSNTIIAQNDDFPDVLVVSGSLASQGHNLIGYGLGALDLVDSDLIGTRANPIDARLAPLADNGGPTQTMALLPGSPALNTGDPTQLGMPDQRGVVRRGDVNKGAYQASASALVVTAPAKVTAGVPFDLTVTALDPFDQLAVGYAGMVTFGTTDPGPGVRLPTDYAFTAADAGVHTFSDTGLGETTLVTRGYQTVAVTDTADASITGGAAVKVRHLRHQAGGRVSGTVGLAVGCLEGWLPNDVLPDVPPTTRQRTS